MTILFVILVVLASVILAFIVLVQNPKGGGLSGTFGGISSQFMGVKQTTDVLEKGTWVFGGLIAVLCLFSTFFMSGSGNSDEAIKKAQGAPVGTQRQTPAVPSNAAPLQQAPAPKP